MNDINNRLLRIFSNNLSRFMAQSGIDRNKLCSDLDLPYSTVSEWLLARKYPRIDKIELLANYFNCKLSDLIEDKPYSVSETKNIALVLTNESDLAEKIKKMNNEELDELRYFVDYIAFKRRKAMNASEQPVISTTRQELNRILDKQSEEELVRLLHKILLLLAEQPQEPQGRQ